MPEKSFVELYALGRKALEVLSPIVDLVEALGEQSEIEVRIASMEPRGAGVAKEMERMDGRLQLRAREVEEGIAELDRHAATHGAALQMEKESLEGEISRLRDQRAGEQGRMRSDRVVFEQERSQISESKITLSNEVKELEGRVASLKKELEAVASKYAAL